MAGAIQQIAPALSPASITHICTRSPVSFSVPVSTSRSSADTMPVVSVQSRQQHVQDQQQLRHEVRPADRKGDRLLLGRGCVLGPRNGAHRRLVVRARWWVIAAWIVAAVVIAVTAPALQSTQDQSEFLPSHSFWRGRRHGNERTRAARSRWRTS